MNFSQDVVQEFQISSVNFDLSTGITGTGAVNIVTRTGGNDFHGNGRFYFRDNNLSAYPALQRSAFNPDPFFARRHSGFQVSGPIKRDRAFFFYDLEHNNQDSVVTILPNSPFFSELAQNASQPYTATQHTARFDIRLSSNHNLFLRYSHDGNKGFGPLGVNQLPSNWVVNDNFSDQSVFGLTSSFGAAKVNDFRFSYQYWHNRNFFPKESDCPGCIGLGLPQMSVLGTNVVFGNTSNAEQGRDLRKFTFVNNFTWQRGAHRLRFGGEFEHAPGTGFWGFAEPAAGVLWGPDLLRQINPALLAVYGIPNSIRTTQDLMRLPLLAFSTGIGDPSQPPPFQIEKARINNRVRWFVQDTWRISQRFTLNFGLAWNYESTLVNHDLDKPQYLAPILGPDGLAPSERDFNNFSPSLGFSWSPGRDNKTVIRAGAGIYYNTRLLWQRLRERALIGPVGNGRVLIAGASIPNPLTNVPNIPGLPAVSLGTPLDFRVAPTGFTLGHLMQALPIVRPQIEATLPKGNDLSVRGIEVAKQGEDIIPRSYPAPYSEHFNIGVQREIANNLVLNADFVFRQFLKDEVGLIDYNRFFAVTPQGQPRRVMPLCSAAERSNPKAVCATGPIAVRTPADRSNYKALLLKADKRFSNRYQFTFSYALQSRHGLNGIWNLDNWFSSWGPQGDRHLLTVSGFVDLPYGLQIGFLTQASDSGAVMPSISQVDFDGDGTTGEPLPGVKFNGFNRGLGKEDLRRAVDQYNQQYAGKVGPRGGRPFPQLSLPADFRFGEPFFTQDFRLTKTFTFAERYRVKLIGEVFNVFNIANLGGYTFDLTSPAFGMPTTRFGQVFGSGGPRAFQLAARFEF